MKLKVDIPIFNSVWLPEGWERKSAAYKRKLIDQLLLQARFVSRQIDANVDSGTKGHVGAREHFEQRIKELAGELTEREAGA